MVLLSEYTTELKCIMHPYRTLLSKIIPTISANTKIYQHSYTNIVYIASDGSIIDGPDESEER